MATKDPGIGHGAGPPDEIFGFEPPAGGISPGGGSSGDVTRGLAELRQGESGALDRLLPLLYDELRRLAHRRLRGERPDHTLDTTGLVHESYLKLATQHGLKPTDRPAFFAAASNTMRRILVDHARGRRRAKRGGGELLVRLEELPPGEAESLLSEREVDETLALETELARLETALPRAAKVFEQRFFGGLELDEIAAAENLSVRTVARDFQAARAWLRLAVGRNLGIG